MTRISRRRLLGGLAVTSLPVALPEAAAGMDNTPVRMLVDAHRAAMGRYDNSPEGEVPDDIIAQMMITGETLCALARVASAILHRRSWSPASRRCADGPKRTASSLRRDGPCGCDIRLPGGRVARHRGCSPRPERTHEAMRTYQPTAPCEIIQRLPHNRPRSKECAPARVVSMLHAMSRGLAEDSGKPLEIKGT